MNIPLEDSNYTDKHPIFWPAQHCQIPSPVTINTDMARYNRKALRRYVARLSIGVEAGDSDIIRLSNKRERMAEINDRGFIWPWL